MKYIVAIVKNGKPLLRFETDEGKKEWAETSQAVVNYAKKNFQENEEVDFEYTVKNGQYNITKILKKGAGGGGGTGTGSDTKTQTQTGSGYAKPGTYNNPTPDEAERKNKLSVLSSSCTAIVAMQGRIDNADTLAEMILTVYDKAYKRLFG